MYSEADFDRADTDIDASDGEKTSYYEEEVTDEEAMQR